MNLKVVSVLLLLISFLLSHAACAVEIKGIVVKIADGDTLTLLDESKQQVKIRLAEIDTPESHQPYGTRAKQELSRLVFGKTLSVDVQDIDRYGRTVGRIYVDGLDINAEMVRRGAAWVYRKYAKDQSLYTLEEQARQNKLGIWSLPEAMQMPPWEWRQARRNK